MSNTQWVALAISSGLVAGVASSVATLLASRWERSHRTRERRAIETHEARLRRELAHDEARSVFLPLAEQFVAWATRYAANLHREEVGTYQDVPSNLSAPSGREDVLDLLLRIRYEHPTRSVRAHAQELYYDIFDQWSEIVDERIPETTLDQADQWLSRAQELVERVHTPEPGDG